MRLTNLALVVIAATSGCEKSHYFQCKDSSSCDLSAGGMCVSGDTGNWCAYPDEDCDSGYRYSSGDVGDENLRGVCLPGTRHTLTVKLGGSGMGTVSSTPNQLTCASGVCTGKFPEGAVVALTATASTGAFLGWSGACMGKAPCSIVMDQDRSADALFGIPGQAMWALQLTGPGIEETGKGVAIDKDGNVIVVGSFTQTIAPKAATPATTLTANGTSSDAFVFKVDGTNGSVIWARQFGGMSADGAAAVAVDSSNNIYIAGSVTGPLDLGAGNVNTTGGDAVILKLGPDGSRIWARVLSGSMSEGANTIAVDADSVVVTGTFGGSMTVDGATSNSAGGPDIFVMSVSPSNGSTQWFKTFGGTSLDIPRAVTIDTTGSVIVTGTFRGTINFGGSTLTAPSTADATFVTKLAGANGAHQISLRAGGDRFTASGAIGSDTSNNVFVAGAFSGTADFGCASSVTSSPPTGGNLYLAKYSQAGSCIWVKPFGSSSTMNVGAFGLSLDGAANPAVTGTFCGSLNLGGSDLASAGSCPDVDVFAARFDSMGGHLNSVRAGGTGGEFAAGVVHAADGRFFVTGQFTGFAEFGGTAFTADGMYDAFLVGFFPL